MSEDIEIRRKRLLFRSRHRGTKELDLLIGSFAERHLPNFDAGELDLFENLLTVPDPQMYDWLVGQGRPPAEFDHAVMRLLLDAKFEPPA